MAGGREKRERKATKLRKYATSSASKRARTEKEHQRALSRISIGEEASRWRTVMEEIGETNHATFAGMLLDCWCQVHARAKHSTPIGFKDDGAKASTSQLVTPAVSAIHRHRRGHDTETSSTLTAMSGISELGAGEGGSTTSPRRRGMTPIPEAPPDVESESTSDSDPMGLRQLDPKDISFIPPERHQLSDTDSESGDEELACEEDHDHDLDNLETTYVDEHLMSFAGLSDQEDEEEEECPVGVKRIQTERELLDDMGGIAYSSCLMSLARLRMSAVCNVKGCGQLYQVKHSRIGTAIYLTWVCISEAEHIGYKWSSQPRLTARGLHAGDFMLAMNTMLSGNNFQKISLLCKFMNVGNIAQSFYDQIQILYCVPTIDQYFNTLMDSARQECTDLGIVVAGDGRNDSPGHSAQYLTYTLMNHDNKDIVALKVVDKREVGLKSPNMEKVGLERCLKDLKDAGVTVTELVTDAHVQIAAIIRKDYATINHQWDVWHGSKNLGKKLTAAGLERGNKVLLSWVKDITRHFWYCSQHANGSQLQFLAHWRGLLHHIVNKHQWAIGDGGGPAGCEHGEIEEQEKPWLEAGSPQHERLRQVVLDKRLVKNSAHYVNFRHTGELESFHNHLLMYVPKRIAFTYPIFIARTHLAAIDYQKHKDLPVALGKDGKERVRRMWSKTSSSWSVVNVKEKKPYTYIPELQGSIINCRLQDTLPMKRKRPLAEEDPRKMFSKTMATTSPPSTSELVQKKKSRFEQT